jgi:oligopeptide transport system ATP-binding protein
MTSLNPYMRVGDQVIEPLVIHAKISREQAWQRGLRRYEVGARRGETDALISA